MKMPLLFGVMFVITIQFFSLLIMPMQQGSNKYKSRLWTVLSIIAFIYGFYLGSTI